MCRFILIKSPKENKTKLLQSFAEMCKNSKALDGDWQGDGWGITWLNNNTWQRYTSLKPIWEEEEYFNTIPPSSIVIAHARSASFPEHKHILEFNQPYISGNYSFVFNGLLKGVRIPFQLEGTIGAQKIWALLQKFLKNNAPETALQKTIDIINKHANTIQALNIGFSDGKQLYAYTQYNHHPEYYNLQISKVENETIICSEELNNYDFKALKTKSIC